MKKLAKKITAVLCAAVVMMGSVPTGAAGGTFSEKETEASLYPAENSGESGEGNSGNMNLGGKEGISSVSDTSSPGENEGAGDEDTEAIIKAAESTDGEPENAENNSEKSAGGNRDPKNTEDSDGRGGDLKNTGNSDGRSPDPGNTDNSEPDAAAVSDNVSEGKAAASSEEMQEEPGPDPDIDPPEILFKMNGGKRHGEKWYYKEDNCGIGLTFSDENIEGVEWTAEFFREAESSDGKKQVNIIPDNIEREKGTIRVYYGAAKIASLGDGEYTVRASARDAAGNVSGTFAADSAGGAISGSRASFVLDMTPPEIVKVISSADGVKYDETVEYNTEMTVSVSINDNNIDASCWQASPEAEINETGMNIVFSFKDGDFVYPEIKGTDFAGNALRVSPAAEMDSENLWSEHGSSVRAELGKVVNTAHPSVFISYAAENDGKPRNRLDSKYLVGNAAYYKDEKVIITLLFRDLRDTDGRSDLDMVKAAFEKDDEKTEAKDAKTLSELGAVKYGSGYEIRLVLDKEKDRDQSVRVRIFGTNRAGTPLICYEQNPSSGEYEEGSTSGAGYSGVYNIVWDRTAPKVHFSVKPDENVKRKGLIQYGGGEAYYFSGGFSVRGLVTDRNLPEDQSTVFIKRAVKNAGSMDYSEPGSDNSDGTSATDREAEDRNDPVIFSDSSDSKKQISAADTSPISGRYDTESHVWQFEDKENAEGVYRYLISGTDLAGNEIEVEKCEEKGGESTLEDGSYIWYSRMINIDRTAPVASLCVTDSDGNIMWEQESGNAPSVKCVFSCAAGADVTLSLGESEMLPVIYTCSVNEKNGRKKRIIQNDDYVFYKKGEKFGHAKVRSEQIFTVSDITLTDLAGNESRPVEETEKFYIDQTPPKTDRLAPGAAVATSNTVRASAYGRRGQPLFGAGTDPVFDVSIIDPSGETTAQNEEERTSSGLKKVYWMLYEVSGSGENEKDEPVPGYEKTELTFTPETHRAPDIYEKKSAIRIDRRVNKNNLKLVVTAEDNSGNIGEGSFYFGIDSGIPSARVSFDNNEAAGEKYFNGPRKAVIEVTDRSFDVERTQILISRDGMEAAAGEEVAEETDWQTKKGSNADGDEDVHSKTITFLKDGHYTFRVVSLDGGPDTAEDEAGNIGQVAYEGSAPNDFVIDTRPPEVSLRMSGTADETDGHFYYRADNAEITVLFSDHGRDIGAASDPACYSVNIDGKYEKCFVPDGTGSTEAVIYYTAEEIASVLQDGTHRVNVTARDAAGNEASEFVKIGAAKSCGAELSGMTGIFILDTENPELVSVTTDPSDTLHTDGKIYDDTKAVYYNEEVRIELTVKDENADRSDFHGFIICGGKEQEADQVTNTESGVCAVFYLKRNLLYEGLTFSGADKAGNLLAVSKHFTASSSDFMRDNGNGSVSAVYGKVIDTVPPVCEIDYCSEASANFYEGECAGKTSAYFNKDAEVQFAFSDNMGLDGRKLYAEVSECVKAAEGSGNKGKKENAGGQRAGADKKGSLYGTEFSSAPGMTSVKCVKINCEGRFCATVCGTDRAMNPVTVREMIPLTVKTYGKKPLYCPAENTAGSYEGCYELVIDKTPPTFTFSVRAPGAARSEKSTVGGRYFFNRDYSAEVRINEENFDPSKINVRRGSVFQGDFDTGSKIISDFSETVTVFGKVIRDTGSENGVYRYAVFGCDKAGNALVPADEKNSPASGADPEAGGNNGGIRSDADTALLIRKTGENLDGTEASLALSEKKELAENAVRPFGTLEESADLSTHIVIDKTPPSGRLEIANGSKVYYRMNINGSVSLAEPYRRERNAGIRFITDTKIEHSPSMIEWSVDANPVSYRSSGTSGGYAFGSMAETKMSGRMQFRVNLFRITDLAGNVTESASPNVIYLDTDPPAFDKLAPSVLVSVRARPDADSGDGRPLFASDVPVKIEITDPYEGSGASGIGKVTFEIYTGGTLRESRVLREDVSGHKASGYENTAPVCKFDSTQMVLSQKYNFNDIKIRVSVRDNAGNTNFGELTFGIDVTPPKIEIFGDGVKARNEKYFNADRTLTAAVTERNFDPAKIRIDIKPGAAVSGWTRKRGKSENGDDDIWMAKISCSEEGNYVAAISGEDLAGNRASDTVYSGRALREFVIDKTKPAAVLRFKGASAKNEKYYNCAVTAEIEVTDANFGGENNIKVNAENTASPEVIFRGKTAELRFERDGSYSFSGTVTDLAGNVSEPVSRSEFTVDTKKPEISFAGVGDMSANRTPVRISFTVKDKNLRRAGVKAYLRKRGEEEKALSGQTENINGGVRVVLDAIEDEGYYTLRLTGTDLAGNVKEKKISFSENQRGVSFKFRQKEADGAYIRKAFTPEFILSDVDEITITSVMVNGQPAAYTFKKGVLKLRDPIESDGKYIITADAYDAAGNVSSMDPVEFILDRTPPRVTVTGLKEGQYYYHEPLELTVRFDNPEDEIKSIVLNNRELGPEEYILNGDGSATLYIKDYSAWHLTASVIDKAGNTGFAEAHFALTEKSLAQPNDCRGTPDTAYRGAAFAIIAGALAAVLIILRIVRKHGN